MSNPLTLSKSQFVKGRQCFKKIWLYNHKRELKDETTDFQEHLFDQGNLVGSLAQTYYPNGKLVDCHYKDFELAIKLTNEYLADDKVEAIYEANFLFDNVIVKVDLLKKNKDGSVDLIEVKSSSSLKKIHIPDLAIQKYIVSNSGLKIRATFLMHVNNKFVKNGEIDPKQLFSLLLLDEEIDAEYKMVPENLKTIKKYAQMDTCPTADIGSVCKSPYPCDFKGYCWKDIGPTSIHHLYSIRDPKRAKLLESGCEDINDIPNDFKLSANQLIQVEVEQSGSAHIESQNIQIFLDKLEYPHYYLDFETLSEAIPRFDGFKPWQHYVFQYSLHIKLSEDSEVTHVEYLAGAGDTPKDAANHLIEQIGESGSIIVYSSFEKNKIRDLIALYPDLEDNLTQVIDRLWDLNTPFAKRWYAQKEFYGRDSIKVVLPALCPDLSYKDLAVQDGGMACSGFLKLIGMDESRAEYAQLRTDLLEYCNLDTFAMVRILHELLNIVR